MTVENVEIILGEVAWCTEVKFPLSYNYFANMKDDYVGLHIFHQLAHPMKSHVDCMCEVCTLYLLYPYREGISIGFNEWKRLLELIPTIHEEYPELAKEQLAHKGEA